MSPLGDFEPGDVLQLRNTSVLNIQSTPSAALVVAVYEAMSSPVHTPDPRVERHLLLIWRNRIEGLPESSVKASCEWKVAGET